MVADFPATAHWAMTSHEEECWREAHQAGELSEQSDRNLKVKCFPIHEPDWKREILVTTAVKDEQW